MMSGATHAVDRPDQDALARARSVLRPSQELRDLLRLPTGDPSKPADMNARHTYQRART
jgi:hypothetical protein